MSLGGVPDAAWVGAGSRRAPELMRRSLTLRSILNILNIHHDECQVPDPTIDDGGLLSGSSLQPPYSGADAVGERGRWLFRRA